MLLALSYEAAGKEEGPALRDALVASAARKVVTLNLEPQSGETEGFSPETHLEVLSAHAPDLKLDVVLVDAGAVVDEEQLRDWIRQAAARPGWKGF